MFALTQGEQGTGNYLFQLAVNRAGVIRGNDYNALRDTTLPVCGPWTRKASARMEFGDRKEPVFEAGFANLTRSETTMLVHSARGERKSGPWFESTVRQAR